MFGDLVEDTAGTYTLVATAGSASAFSRPFVVKAAAASQLIFLSQPGNGKAGTALSPFIVEALDSFGNVATTSPTAIRISDGTLSKGPYLTNALGQAVIANWTETMAGTDTLTASATGVTSAESNSFTIAPGAGMLSFVSQPSQDRRRQRHRPRDGADRRPLRQRPGGSHRHHRHHAGRRLPAALRP